MKREEGFHKIQVKDSKNSESAVMAMENPTRKISLLLREANQAINVASF
jgi:hypothetical protein